MSIRLSTLALIGGAGLAAAIGPLAAPAAAMPVSHALKDAAPSAVETVRWGRGGWGWGVGGGLLAGAIVGGALASPYYYGGYPYAYYPGPYPAYPAPYPPPAPAYYGGPPPGPGYGGPPQGGPGGDAVAYCMQRFRSYNPQTGTYLGLDNQRHSCP